MNFAPPRRRIVSLRAIRKIAMTTMMIGMRNGFRDGTKEWGCMGKRTILKARVGLAFPRTCNFLGGQSSGK